MACSIPRACHIACFMSIKIHKRPQLRLLASLEPLAAAGMLAASGTGYRWVWLAMALMYFSSALVWKLFMWGQPLTY